MGREEVNVFNRTIPRELLQRATSITLASSLFVCFVVSILLFSADYAVPPAESRHLFVSTYSKPYRRSGPWGSP